MKFKLMGLFLGSIASYIWVYNPHCTANGCPLTSNLYLTSIWGGMMGYLVGGVLFDFIHRNK